MKEYKKEALAKSTKIRKVERNYLFLFFNLCLYFMCLIYRFLPSKSFKNKIKLCALKIFHNFGIKIPTNFRNVMPYPYYYYYIRTFFSIFTLSKLLNNFPSYLIFCAKKIK